MSERANQFTYIVSIIFFLAIIAEYIVLNNNLVNIKDETDNQIQELNSIISDQSQLILIQETKISNLEALVSQLESTINELVDSVIELKKIHSLRYVDFNSFFEVDTENNWISIVSSNKIVHTTGRSQSTYAYKDYGEGYFGDFVIDFDFKADYADVYTLGYPFMLSNNINDFASMFEENGTAIGVSIYHRDQPPHHRIHLCEAHSGRVYYDSFNNSTPNMKYYVRVQKEDTNLICNIFSSDGLRHSGGTGDVASLALTLQSDYSFRYLYCASSHDSDFPLNRNSEIITENMMIQSVTNGQ